MSDTTIKPVNPKILKVLYYVNLFALGSDFASLLNSEVPDKFNSAFQTFVVSLLLASWGAEKRDWTIGRLTIPFLAFTALALLGHPSYLEIIPAQIALLAWIKFEIHKSLAPPSSSDTSSPPPTQTA